MDISEIKRIAAKNPVKKRYDIRQARIDLTAALRSASRMRTFVSVQACFNRAASVR